MRSDLLKFLFRVMDHLTQLKTLEPDWVNFLQFC